MTKRRAIYPGSFDPVTYGHLDLILRATELFDEVIVAVAKNAEKEPFFSLEERVSFIEKSVQGIRGVSIDSFHDLTVDYAVRRKANTIIRGLRATSDFDYEFQMALTNRRLSKKVDTVFLMPSESHFYLSSRLVKEIGSMKGDIKDYVPPHVAKAIKKRFG